MYIAYINSNSEIVVMRKPGEGEVDAIKFVFKNLDGESVVVTKNTPLDELEAKKFTFALSGQLSNVNSVEIYPLIITSSGKEVVG